MFDTQVTVVGNLVADPRLNFTKDGQPVASFRVASTPRRFDRASGEWRDGDTLYASVTCWRGLAENVMASLKKGQAAIVIGKLSVRPYETKEGEKRQSVDIEAQAVGPDLARVVTVIKRAERGVAPTRTPALVAVEGGDRAGAADERVYNAAHAGGVAGMGGAEPAAEGYASADDDLTAEDDELGDDLTADDDELVGAVGGGGRLKARFGLG